MRNGQTSISLITAYCNEELLLSRCLESVANQSFKNFELILIDDGSTDNTDDVLAGYCKKDSRFQYHHRPKERPKGGNAARNYGFELSNGEYIQWFDDDDILLKIFL